MVTPSGNSNRGALSDFTKPTSVRFAVVGVSGTKKHVTKVYLGVRVVIEHS